MTLRGRGDQPGLVRHELAAAGALREPGSGRGMQTEEPSPRARRTAAAGRAAPSRSAAWAAVRPVARPRSRGRGTGSPSAARSPTAAPRRAWWGGGRSSTGSGASSASVSMPALRSMSRFSDRASSVTTASSDSRARSAGWRMAVFARVVATSSRRLSFSVRREFPMVSSARTPGALLAQHQGDGLELRARGRRDPAAAQGVPDVLDGVREHGHDVLAPASSPPLPGGGVAPTGLGWPCRAMYLLRNARQGTAGHRAAGGVSQREPGRFLGDSHWAAVRVAAAPRGPRHRSRVTASTALADRAATRARRAGSISIIPPGDRRDTRRRVIDHPLDDGPSSRRSWPSGSGSLPRGRPRTRRSRW